MSTNEKEPTEFLPAERAPAAEVKANSKALGAIELMRSILDTVPDPVLILNDERQIVFSNKAFLEMVGLDHKKVLGMRMGEAVGCEHASETDGGCGTTQFCRECGVPKSFLAAQNGKQGREECRITQKSGDALEFRVWTTKFTAAGSTFTAAALTDMRHENRRRALERIFFHDIMNTASGLSGISGLFKEATPAEKEDFQGMICACAEKLLDEIEGQRQISEAENHDLQVSLGAVDSLELLQEMVVDYRVRDVADGKTIKLDRAAAEKKLKTDRVLLRRVLGNMTKNALEASGPEDTVTLGCDQLDDALVFWVHNPAVMPKKIQLQVFRRSFSTKGAGRGLGSYSMKLLTEHYLKGQMNFTSAEGEGTRFTCRLPLEI